MYISCVFRTLHLFFSGVVENGFDEGVFRESDKNEEEVSKIYRTHIHIF